MVNLLTKITFLCVIGVAIFMGFSTTSTAGSDGIRQVWNVKTGHPVNLPPVVSGNAILLSPDGKFLLALNATDGSELWKFTPSTKIWERSIGADKQRAYVCTKGGKITALDVFNGSRIWETALGIDCQRQPHISGGKLYISTTLVGPGLSSEVLSGAKFFSLDPETGKINWEFTTENYLLQTASSANGTVYVGGSYHDAAKDVDEGGFARFYALDGASGKMKWTHESEDGLPKALYANKERLIYIAYQDFLVGLDTANGSPVWRNDTGNWVQSINGVDDVVYFGSANTNVHAWDTLTGKERWTFNIQGGSFNYMLGKPLLDGDAVYFISQKGTIFALNSKTGKELWSQDTNLSSRVGLSVGNRMIFIGDAKGNIYAYRILK